MLPNCGGARRLCHGGATRPGEAGGREVESSPQGVELRYERVVALTLEARIVEDKASHRRYQG